MTKNAPSFISWAQSCCSGHRNPITFLPFLIMLLMAIPLLAENGYITNIPITTEIGGELFYSFGIDPQSIYTCSDDGVVVIALSELTADEIFGVTMAVVVKLDSNGNLEWKRLLGWNSDYEYVTGIGIDENDTVSFIAGSYDNPSESSIIKIDRYGAHTQIPLWVNNVSNYRVAFNKAIFTPSGDIVAVGFINSAEFSWIRRLAFCRFNSAGELLASAYIPADTISFTNTNAYDVVMEDNGNALVAGRLHSNYYDLLRIDMNGSLAERIPLQGYASQYDDYAIHLHHNPGSDHCLIAFNDSPLSPQSSFSIARLTVSGISYYPVPHLFYWDNSSFIEHGDTVYFVGSNNNTGTKLYRYDYTGNYSFIWSWSNPNIYFGDTLYYTVTSTSHTLASSNNGSILVAGVDSGSLAIAKLLPSGQLPIEDEVQAPAMPSITIYPNPMKQIVNIHIEYESDSMQTKINVYNLRGQKVKTITTDDKGTGQWDGTDLDGSICPHGIYFIRDTKGLCAIKKIVKQ